MSRNIRAELRNHRERRKYFDSGEQLPLRLKYKGQETGFKSKIRIEYTRLSTVKKRRTITSDFQVQKTQLKLDEISKTVRKLRASMGGFASSKKRGSKKKLKSVKKDYKTFRKMEIETKLLLKAYKEEAPREEEYEEQEPTYTEEEFETDKNSTAWEKMVNRLDELRELEDAGELTITKRPLVNSP